MLPDFLKKIFQTTYQSDSSKHAFATYEGFVSYYKYDVRRHLLGEGGFSQVYKAMEGETDRYVAIKISPVKKGQENLSLRHEVELAKKLPVHKTIAIYDDCYRFITPQGEYDYGVMQYYPDGNLSQLIQSKKLSLEQKKSIATGILEGLNYLHNHDIVHRDLKSSNILIAKRESEYVPKIADFGLSKSTGGKDMISNSVVGGSIHYASPELLQGKELGKNADIWSLGVILIELFTGILPFYANKAIQGSAAARQEIMDKIYVADITEQIKDIPKEWQKVIKRCLIVDQDKRAKYAEELKEILVELPSSYSGVTDPEIPKIINNNSANSEIMYKKLSIVLGAILISIIGYLGYSKYGNKIGFFGDQDLHLVAFKDGDLFGYKDTLDHIIHPAQYDLASEYYDGKALVKVQDSIYFMDKKGKIIKVLEPNGFDMSGNENMEIKDYILPDSKDTVLYYGEVKNGVPHGIGKVSYKDSSLYIGNFESGVIKGFGKWYYLKRKFEFIGNFDKIDSAGLTGLFVIYYENNKMIGNYDHDNFTGYISYSDDQEQYSGYMLNYKKHGNGFYKSKDVIYNGEYKNGKKQGNGKIEYKDGSSYDGEWLEDDYHGFGKYIANKGYNVKHCPSCQKYIGQWFRGEKNGQGKCYDKDNEIIYQGEFKNNAPVDKYPSN